jgi:hypothetical protein
VYPAYSLSLSWILFCTTGTWRRDTVKHSKWGQMYIRDACVPTSDLFSFHLIVASLYLTLLTLYHLYQGWLYHNSDTFQSLKCDILHEGGVKDKEARATITPMKHEEPMV